MSRTMLSMVAVGGFVLATLGLPLADPWLRALFPDLQRVIYADVPAVRLALSHLGIALPAAVAATTLGMGAGIVVSLGRGMRLRPFVETLFTLAQAVPPIAVVALALPVFGFGAPAVLIALVLYAALPVLRATMAGLETVPADTIEAARAMGLTPLQRMMRIRLPLAGPGILAGIRMATALSIATTAVGSIAGIESLGTPIIVGLSNANPAYVLQGGVLTAWLALAVDRAFAAVAAPAWRTA